ncbi:hypothetical protein [Novosphingobium huizhouense]|uniref:hypothetical protein n=1 Tax=Novosphingobium huizhouense TaxID=2866625 RepID=UPI001CD8C3F6|nr:hypothetical protein [Novosphingobium huizhouense]
MNPLPTTLLAFAMSVPASGPLPPTAPALLPIDVLATADKAEMNRAGGGRPQGGHAQGGHAAGNHARPAGGAGGHAQVSRPSGRPPVRDGAHTNINYNNRTTVNVNNGGGRRYDDHYDHHDHHRDWDDDWDDHWHPVRTATTVAVTAAVIGSIVRTLPPSCSTVNVNGIAYSQCGSTWYEPRYSGTSVQYVVVNPPR